MKARILITAGLVCAAVMCSSPAWAWTQGPISGLSSVESTSPPQYFGVHYPAVGFSSFGGPVYKTIYQASVPLGGTLPTGATAYGTVDLSGSLPCGAVIFQHQWSAYDDAVTDASSYTILGTSMPRYASMIVTGGTKTITSMSRQEWFSARYASPSQVFGLTDIDADLLNAKWLGSVQTVGSIAFRPKSGGGIEYVVDVVESQYYGSGRYQGNAPAIGTIMWIERGTVTPFTTLALRDAVVQNLAHYHWSGSAWQYPGSGAQQAALVRSDGWSYSAVTTDTAEVDAMFAHAGGLSDAASEIATDTVEGSVPTSDTPLGDFDLDTVDPWNVLPDWADAWIQRTILDPLSETADAIGSLFWPFRVLDEVSE